MHNTGVLWLALVLIAATRATAAPETPADFAADVARTMSDCTVRARVGPARTPLPRALSNFLLDHPDLSAFIVNRRKLAPYRIEMTGPRQSLADDGDGTQGVVNLVHREERHRLYYGEGVHHSLLFPPIHADAVIVMDLADDADEAGRPQTVTTFEVYVRLRSRFLSGVVKTLRPFIQKTVLGKFTKVLLVADQVGELMAKAPADVENDARDFPRLRADERAELLAMISGLKSSPPPVSSRP